MFAKKVPLPMIQKFAFAESGADPEGEAWKMIEQDMKRKKLAARAAEKNAEEGAENVPIDLMQSDGDVELDDDEKAEVAKRVRDSRLGIGRSLASKFWNNLSEEVKQSYFKRAREGEIPVDEKPLTQRVSTANRKFMNNINLIRQDEPLAAITIYLYPGFGYINESTLASCPVPGYPSFEDWLEELKPEVKRDWLAVIAQWAQPMWNVMRESRLYANKPKPEGSMPDGSKSKEGGKVNVDKEEETPFFSAQKKPTKLTPIEFDAATNSVQLQKLLKNTIQERWTASGKDGPPRWKLLRENKDLFYENTTWPEGWTHAEPTRIRMPAARIMLAHFRDADAGKITDGSIVRFKEGSVSALMSRAKIRDTKQDSKAPPKYVNAGENEDHPDTNIVGYMRSSTQLSHAVDDTEVVNRTMTTKGDATGGITDGNSATEHTKAASPMALQSSATASPLHRPISVAQIFKSGPSVRRGIRSSSSDLQLFAGSTPSLSQDVSLAQSKNIQREHPTMLGNRMHEGPTASMSDNNGHIGDESPPEPQRTSSRSIEYRNEVGQEGPKSTKETLGGTKRKAEGLPGGSPATKKRSIYR
ncbi:hypothetical protein CPB86DRAFT_626524 [Serendipita vermifera]|nr:hypothetical protein CPB86DRAFT_626524 [Serendipita vermifera]